jgi:hypothetical protein
LFSGEKGPNYAFDERGTCSECGKGRKEYDSRDDFLFHVGVCGTIKEPMKSLKRSRGHFIEESRIIGISSLSLSLSLVRFIISAWCLFFLCHFRLCCR